MCVCVCVREGEREREKERKEHVSKNSVICTLLPLSKRKKERVCARERDNEREREREEERNALRHVSKLQPYVSSCLFLRESMCVNM